MQRERHRKGSTQFFVAALVGALACATLIGTAWAAEPEDNAETVALKRQVSMNNIKQIVLAMHNYHDTYKAFPPAFSTQEGKPLLSWRVALLPFLDEGNRVYADFHLDEPWDSEHNKPLVAKMPQIFQSPASGLTDGRTVYLTPRGADTMFPGEKAVKIRSIVDGTSRTIALVEADDDRAVEWTRPDDWTFDPKHPKAGLGGLQRGGFLTGFGDGHATFFPNTIDADKLKTIFTISGREPD